MLSEQVVIVIVSSFCISDIFPMIVFGGYAIINLGENGRVYYAVKALFSCTYAVLLCSHLWDLWVILVVTQCFVVIRCSIQEKVV